MFFSSVSQGWFKMRRKTAPNRSARSMTVLFVAFLMSSCASTIAVFDQRAYENATSLKPAALMLMDQATQPFADHSAEVRALMTNVAAAYEYANGIPKNQISASQWRILKDPDGGLLGGFLKLWEDQGTLLEGDIKASKKNVSDAFDTIIELEAAKIKG